MLVRQLTTILPAMTFAEAIETTRIHRVAGLTGDRGRPADRAGIESLHGAHPGRAACTQASGWDVSLP